MKPAFHCEETMTQSNPFYATSASAMLLGCWLLSQALQLEAGQLQGLLVLMLVLQVYEALLVGLGAYLIRSKRSPRDGLVVLVLESVFLMDATLLSAECVTTDLTVGTVVAGTTATLAVLKLQWVRRAAPDLLPKKVARVLALHALVILALPVAAAHLADHRHLSPLVLYGFWWLTAALPLAHRLLRDETQAKLAEPGRAHAVWSWMPCGLVLLHLWTVGYIHSLDFRPAFLAPFLLGLAVAADRGRQFWQLMLPGIAVLFSLGKDPELIVHLFGPGGVSLSPLRLAVIGVGLTWAYLAWRDRDPWLIALALGSGVLGLLGSTTLRLIDALGRWLASAVPRDGFGWGALALIAAFALLAAGARRSLQGEPRWPGRPPGMKARTGDVR
jgi:hypothetical protein